MHVGRRHPLFAAAQLAVVTACGAPGSDRDDGPERPTFPPLPDTCAHSLPPTEEPGGWKIDRQGYLDTDLELAELFAGPSTIAAWVMPEYTYNDYGSIFAAADGGPFVLGQGDYRQGNGGYKTGGDPVLFLQVGPKTAYYLAPNYKRRAWNHVALVHADDDATSSFHLFVNGERLTPIVPAGHDDALAAAPEIAFTADDPLPPQQRPAGSLWLGRRATGVMTEPGQTWQFYGLIDDLAVFDAALDEAGILSLLRCGLTGAEEALRAGWTFDRREGTPPDPLRELDPPPAPADRFVAWVALTDAKWRENRDHAIFDDEERVAVTRATYRLPFAPGEVWRVIQEFDSREGSHNGYAAFCWDFVREDGAALAQFEAASSGLITRIEDGRVPAPGERESNSITILAEDGEYNLYLHNESGSFSEVFLAGGTLDHLPQEGPQHWLAVERGQPLARVGRNAAHLHLDGSDGFTTTPLAFSDYEVWDEDRQAWQPVRRGQPRDGQRIRRPQ